MRLSYLAGSALAAVAGSFVTASAQVPSHYYEFNGSYADANGGPSLAPNGGTLAGGGYAFGKNQGLSVTGAFAAPDNYSILIDFRFDEVDGYRRIVDFKNFASDTGYYVRNSSLNFFNQVTGPANAVPANTLVRTVLTRDAATDTLTGYVNGVQQFQFVDNNDLASFTVAGRSAYLFQDDTVVTGEASAGFADRVAFFDTPLTAPQVLVLGGPSTFVPEPSAMATLALGVIAAARRVRR